MKSLSDSKVIRKVVYVNLYFDLVSSAHNIFNELKMRVNILFPLLLLVVSSAVGDTSNETCPGFVCPNTRMCIPSTWICDGDNDCGDMSDEQNCPSTTTTQCTGFICNDGECLPETWQCDGEPDCDGDLGEDEAGCACHGYQCSDGRCIPSGWTCDGDDDCGDFSDEKEEACPCTDDEVRCPKVPDQQSAGSCITQEYICDTDGICDCPNCTDQANCTTGASTTSSPGAVAAGRRGHGQRSGSMRANSIRRLTKAYEVEAYEQKYSEKRQSQYYNNRSHKDEKQS